MDDDMVPYEKDAVKFVRQVLEGLLFLHERNLAHLDIKVGRNSTGFHVLKRRLFLIPNDL